LLCWSLITVKFPSDTYNRNEATPPTSTVVDLAISAFSNYLHSRTVHVNVSAPSG
jgi:hypothetical protein